MPLAGTEAEAARRQLQRVLASAGFSRNKRLAKFLQFVVEEHLNGRDGDIKESVIAVEVFGRASDHDPKQDSIVRTEAARLRARLGEYYLGEGKNDAVVIELPKGGYGPVFQITAKPEPALATPAPDPPRTAAGLRLWVALAGIAVALGALGWWWFQHQRAPIPIAVLPLTNLSHDPTNEHFADGLTNEIIRNLSLIDGLAVRSQTSSFAFKGNPPNVREAGKQLGADYILEGSVLRNGQQFRINVQLVRVRDDLPLWSGRYDRELTDVFAIQDEISRGIVNSLRLKLGRGRRRYETSVEAYDLYLRARALLVRGNAHGHEEIIDLLGQAIAKDSSFAPAYAGLAAAHAARSVQFRFATGDEAPRSRAAAEKAIQLDPLLAEAHAALGMAYTRDGRWEQSEQSFRRAIGLDPSRSESYRHFASFLLLPLGRIEEALRQLSVAKEADPLSWPIHFYLAYVLISAGRYNEAAAELEKQPGDLDEKALLLGRIRLGQGRSHEAIEIFETALKRGVGAGSDVWGELGYAYAQTGRREEAEKLLSAIPSRNPINHAVVFAGLGDKDRTFEALDRAATVGPVRLGWALTWPEMSLLHGDPRVKALRKKVGLPE